MVNKMKISKEKIIFDLTNPPDKKMLDDITDWVKKFKNYEIDVSRGNETRIVIRLAEKGRIYLRYYTNGNECTVVTTYVGNRGKLKAQRKLSVILETVSIPNVLPK
jgi:hypothetical protein